MKAPTPLATSRFYLWQEWAMPRTIWLAVLVIGAVLTTGGTGLAQAPTLTVTTSDGVIQGNNVNFPVTGDYNTGGQGNVQSVKTTDANDENPTYSDPVLATLPGGNPTPNSGTYNGIATVPYTANYHYYVKVTLFNTNGFAIKETVYVGIAVVNNEDQ
jgi:hypothetical protein